MRVRELRSGIDDDADPRAHRRYRIEENTERLAAADDTTGPPRLVQAWLRT